MEEFRFFDWDVYKDAKHVVKRVFSITNSLPLKYKSSLGDQLNRSVVSIVLNIAEGSGRYTDKELIRFFDIAIGSIYETMASLDLAQDNGLLSKQDFEETVEKLKSIARQLGGFKRKLKS